MAIIEQRSLENKMTLTVDDQSKKMVGDRWLVKIICEAELPVEEEFFSRVSEADLDLQAEIREKMAGSVKFLAIKERTFIAESERAALVEGMVTEILTNMVAYLNRPGFPEKLFARKYEEMRKACDMARHYRRLKVEDGEIDDADDGPLDFSACFKE
ncbi:MAG: hypothetical protein A2505_02155 [Deltaproteobacteria bacterium RIFOXYD12_FULL_55_16]|nr:MAG: hypothetical protein A2505_02155 [Deltaproteobacteria bacterium RIFOXYD12_FULL_55_16]